MQLVFDTNKPHRKIPFEANLSVVAPRELKIMFKNEFKNLKHDYAIFSKDVSGTTILKIGKGFNLREIQHYENDDFVNNFSYISKILRSFLPNKIAVKTIKSPIQQINFKDYNFIEFPKMRNMLFEFIKPLQNEEFTQKQIRTIFQTE